MKQKLVLGIALGLLLIVMVGLVWTQLKGRPATVPGMGQSTQETSAPTQQSGMQPSESSQPTPVVGALKVATPVTLSVTSPANGTTVSSSPVPVTGKTVPNAEVFINDTEVKADAQGSFSVRVPLEEGENPLIVVANDADGNVAEAELTVIYDSGK